MKITNELYDIIEETKKDKTKAYDTPAQVTRTEGSTLWVHIPGGVQETPIKKTVNASPGDTVQVRVSGGTAWVVGNASAPPTDDTMALNALNHANTAASAAASAVQSANTAQEAAGRASAAATRAEGKADDAADAASAAQTSASNASEYAARALGNLASVESVAETLSWITAHGTMALTQDQQLDPTHVYFIQDNNGDYTVGGTRYSIVTEPDAADLSTYYELTIDQSLNNYVATHLAVDGEGLWLLPDAGGDKVLIATGAGSTYTTAGTYIIGKVNNVDKVLAQFLATGATVGNIDGAHSVIDANGQRFYASDGTTELGAFTPSGVRLGQNTVPHMFVGPSGSGGAIIFYQNDQDAPAVLNYASSNNGSYYNDAELTVGDLSTLGAMLKLLTDTADMSKGSRILLETRTGTTALNGKEAHLSLGYNGADVYMRVYDDQTSKKAQALLDTSGFTIDNLQGTNYLSLSFPNGDLVTSGNIEDGAGNKLSDIANIGTVYTGNGSKSITSGTSWVTTGQTQSLPAGVYMCVASCNFPANTSGRRGVSWYDGSSNAIHSQQAVSVVSTSGNSGIYRLNSTAILKLSSSATVRVNCFQSSGSAMTVETYWRIVRIA